MRKILLILLFSVFLMGIVNAENPCGDDDSFLGYGKQGETITLSQRCPSCTFVNLTSISYPNLTTLNFNTGMIQSGIEFNLSFGSTSESGCYSYSVLGDKDGTDKVETFDFKINPTGVAQTSILNNAIPIILILLALLFLGLGLGFQNPALGFIGSILLILSGIYLMIYGFNDTTNLYTRGVAITMLGLGIIFMIVSAYEWLPYRDEDE